MYIVDLGNNFDNETAFTRSASGIIVPDSKKVLYHHLKSTRALLILSSRECPNFGALKLAGEHGLIAKIISTLF